MASAVVGVFDEINEAQSAVNELLVSGFEKNQIKLSGEEKGTSGDQRRDGGGVGGFFRSLLGKQQYEDIGIYSDAVKHGNFVLTAIAPTDEKVALASEVMSHHHPLNLDERSEQWMAESGQTQPAEGFEGKSIPVVEEEVKVGKRQVQRGGVRVFQKISETPIEQDIELREEKVTVERRPVNKPIEGSSEGAFKEDSFEVRETAEEAVVAKTARVVEEVKVGKEVGQRKEKIRETVRKTNVEVQPLEAESSFRSHFEQNYRGSGGRYEDYQPGYQYGAQMAGNEQYRGRQWSEIEPNLRADWERKNPDSAWEKFKASIRHAFERMKS